MTRHWLVIQEVKIVYRCCGSGPPALLLHGYGHTWQMWQRPVEQYLQRHYRCYIPDLPGHGHSDKPPLAWFNLDNFTETVLQFCQMLGLQNILLIGYSMGGMISLNLALHQPELVTNLITVNAPVHGQFLTGFDWLVRLAELIKRPLAEKLFRLYLWHHLLSIPVEVRRYAHPRLIFSPSCYRVQRELAQTTVQTLLGNFKVIRLTDLRPYLPRLHPPLLAITSDKDRVVPPAHTRLLAERVPQARFTRIPDSGHLPIDEQPELFDTALCDYLEISQTLNET